MDTQKLTPINELGEFGLIEYLQKFIPIQLESTIKAGGDDAAVLNYGNNEIIVSTDSYIENVHFDLVYTPLQHLGYKCITASISDIYAMNANAQHVVVALGLSSRFTVEGIEELYRGILAACKEYKIDLIGGDTTSSRSGLTITVTALGSAKKEKLTYRDSAKQNDILVVSGDLGGAYLGLQILEREKRIFLEQPNMQPELEGNDYVLRRQLRPEARKDVVQILDELNIKPTSMIDISDGLASETLHLCRQSKLGCVLFEENIPLDDTTYQVARKLNLDPTLCALSGGEDYELLFTINPNDHEKIRNHPDFTVIGFMQEPDAGTMLHTKSGNRHPLKAQGFKHF